MQAQIVANNSGCKIIKQTDQLLQGMEVLHRMYGILVWGLRPWTTTAIASFCDVVLPRFLAQTFYLFIYQISK